MSDLVAECYPVQLLLAIENICIPGYQRPYKWQEKHVRQLVNDIQQSLQQGHPTYRIGTAVLHQHDGTFDIVDGQQRLVTLTLILYALGYEGLSLLDNEFPHDESKAFLHQNYTVIENWQHSLTLSEQEEIKAYILSSCEFVVVILEDLSEAFQFFDAQNSRGRALEPFDLLKAFHLREMKEAPPLVKLRCTQNWENAVETGELGDVIGNFLFRIRKWTRGGDAGKFGKDDIGEFKGVTLAAGKEFPYLRPYRLNDSVTTQYQKDEVLSAFATAISYPFQINQLIINGLRFFEMVDYYIALYRRMFSRNESSFFAHYDRFTGYEKSWRTGDRYVKALYQALILAYVDRFGLELFEAVYPRMYIWSYKLRLEKTSVRYESINAHIRENKNAFKKLSFCFEPAGALAIGQGLALEKIGMQQEEIESEFRRWGFIIPQKR